MGRVSDFIREQGITLDGQKRTKMLALDDKVTAIEQERDALKAENLELRAQVKPLERENERLKERVKEQVAQPKEKSVVQDERLGDLEETIMSYMDAMGSRENRTLRKIADAMRHIDLGEEISETKVEVCLHRLEKQREYVEKVPNYEGPTYWSLKMRGKEYLLRWNLDWKGRKA